MQATTVAVIAFNGISPFHLAVPCAVFGEDSTGATMPKFKLLVCAAETGTLQTTAGFAIQTRHTLRALTKAEIIIVPSWRDPAEVPSARLLKALRQASERGAQIVGLCLGSFVLAAAGLLDNRTATTHWYWADELAKRYPRIRVDPNVLYIDDGNILTSAGTAAAIDCCLHMLRVRYGAKIANQVARRMVVSPHRQGGQAQYIQQPVRETATVDHFAKVLEWLKRNLDKPHSLDALAERAIMTRRTFTRRFRQIMGVTVGEWLLSQKLNLAQQLLETTNKPIDVVAEKAGFNTSASLRQHFTHAFGISPANYRRQFRGQGVY